MRVQRTESNRTEGYALFSVTVFALIIILAGMTFFAMASYETKGAIYRQNSSEAFYLADAGIERAKARFLEDRAWRDGWTDAGGGRGAYDVTVADTTYMGEDAVVVFASGAVQNATRNIEAIVEIPPTAFDLAMLIMGDAEVGGNLCLEGDTHVNGEAMGNNPVQDPHFQCDYSYTEGFEITPPPMFTDPGHYPGATYYYVRGNKIGSQYQARIYDAAGNDLTTALNDSLVDITSYHSGSKTFTFEFDSHALIEHYFNDSTGIFRRIAPDSAVVVNFGEPSVVTPPGAEGVTSLIFDGNGNSTIHATIINARFTGTADSLRIDHNYWKGAITEVKQIKFEPYFGVALVAYDLSKDGSSHVWIGTPAWPALLYVTRDVDRINSNFHLVGGMICLRDFISTGGPDVTYDEGFLEHLPGWLQDGWDDGVSGTMKILSWRELAAGV